MIDHPPINLFDLTLIGEMDALGRALETDDDKTMYAIGYQTALGLQTFELDAAELELVIAGMREGHAGSEPRVDLRTFVTRAQEMARTRMEKAAGAELTASSAWLAEVASQKGAAKKDSGLIFVESQAGAGDSPGETSRVKVHYHGTFRDGRVFDSSVDRGEPAEFGLNQVIPCWTEALQLMKPGGKATLYCPAAIAYGERGRPGSIPPNAALKFEVELLEVLN